MKKLILLTLSTLLLVSASAISQEKQVTKIKIGKSIAVSVDDSNKKILTVEFQTKDAKDGETIDTLVIGEDTVITIRRTHTIDLPEDKTVSVIVNGDTLVSDQDSKRVEMEIDTIIYTMDARFDSLIYDTEKILNAKELEDFSELDEDFDIKIEIPDMPEISEMPEMPEMPEAPSLREEIENFDEENPEACEEKKSKFEGHWAGFEFGFIGLTADKNFINGDYAYSNRPFRSWNFGINLIPINIPLIAENFGIVTGIGMGWKNYHFANQYLLTTDEQGVSFEPLENPASKITKNRLSSFYLSMPLAFELQFPIRHHKDKFFMQFGGYGNLKLDSDYRYEIETNGVTEEKKLDGDFYLADFEYGLTARIGFDHLNLFANYSMNELFRDHTGPAVHPVTVGIMVIPFY